MNYRLLGWVHQRMPFLRESKESGRANLPFRLLNLTFIQEFGLLREEVLSDIEFQLCQEITTLIRSVPLVILQEKSRNWTSQLIGSLLTHWVHRDRIAHKRFWMRRFSLYTLDISSLFLPCPILSLQRAPYVHLCLTASIPSYMNPLLLLLEKFLPKNLFTGFLCPLRLLSFPSKPSFASAHY